MSAHKTTAEGQEVEEAQSFLGQHLREVAVDYSHGIFSGTNDVVSKIGGISGTTIEEFVAKNSSAFERKVAK